MSSATQPGFAKDAWQSSRNARTLRAFMALQNQEIAARIRTLRANKGNPPQPLVADAVGVAERTYQTWEGGEAKPGYRNLERLATYFGVSENYILTGVEPAATPNPFELSDQAGAVRNEFREDVDDLKAHLAALEQRLDEQNDLLARQSVILERIEQIAEGIPTPQELASEAEALARAGAAARQRSSSPKGATHS